MKEIHDMIIWMLQGHKLMIILFYIPCFVLILLMTWIGMCIGGGQD